MCHEREVQNPTETAYKTIPGFVKPDYENKMFVMEENLSLGFEMIRKILLQQGNLKSFWNDLYNYA